MAVDSKRRIESIYGRERVVLSTKSTNRESERMKFSKLALLPAVLLSTACSLFGSRPNTNPAPMSPATISVSAAQATETTISWNLTCVVPTAPIGGAIEACDWTVKVNGTAITKPTAGFTTTVTIDRPAPTVTVTLNAEVRSIRRGLLSNQSFNKSWSYTEADVAPPVPTNVTVTFAVIGDSVQANLVCAVPANEDIETCAWNGTTKLSTDTGSGVPVVIANGLTTAFKFAKPEPTQTVIASVAATSVRRTLFSTTQAVKETQYTQPDVNPPAPNDVIIQIIP